MLSASAGFWLVKRVVTLGVHAQICLLLSGFAFGAGLVLLAAAQDIAMVIIGRQA